ncbi:hypothetical protein SAMN05428974_1731 [Sphingopyxis sp. YR583]|uniref:hypothetical protein n=1 Tax=Sphingopyxis sp. YR583 TaxID=1881047 RepID=UPI0008A72767|nr:hypothetical protein [Sphingopyxis sp. YR583]SEH16476.1 hypothetical protein SAMN05428974_1731 [Sphingopyxis sp. YR583]
MPRWVFLAATLLLAACSGGKDEESGPEASASIGPLQKAERPAPAEKPEPAVDADLPDAAAEAPTKPEPKTAGDGKTIPAAIRGRWALKAADCKAKKGSDLTALTIDATNLRFYESHGELARVRDSDAGRIVADYKFSGEGVEWDRRMQLDLADGGKTLIRRDEGEGAAAGPMRYTRCV